MAPQIHLLVAIHGMWGNPDHLAALVREISTIAATDEFELNVLVAETNRSEHTYDGIDHGGERIVVEIDERIKSLEETGAQKVTRISVAGYSLGGLLSRYVIGILHSRKFFEKVKPINFNTFASPHIGLPRYPSLLSSIVSAVGSRLLSRTGEQFYGTDRWSGGKPLLEIMSETNSVFYEALNLFPQLTIYANAVHDTTVPYITAAIDTVDPFVDHEKRGLTVKYNSAYKPLIESYATGQPEEAHPRQRKPLFPPALQDLGFPLNVILIIALPLFLPLIIIIVLIRFSLDSRASRKRIKLLEADKHRASGWLSTMLQDINQEVGDVVADIAGAPDDPDDPEAGTSLCRRIPKDQKAHPILSKSQMRMVANLNTLPNLKRQRAFIHPELNTHGVIICREEKRFESHKVGLGVVRHWRDNFQL
ncbi:hypothetical protein BOTBODRAFT_33099 [Botryobasidium botryosum FD-172 SS1]|uniref:DUF676 domain-containing protein n=1 Tax=Botryobasidium botryosum (strain FD-172 SS1) TaxID=930990 RepID=A0A067MQ26_BOTB1|nr:hypothetical protein BOTBODRAFT_33099 [Botryobasidium botryosum FD-172 SS1]